MNARFLSIHPENPQPRLISQVTEAMREGALIAYPTDSCFALGCTMNATQALEKIRLIRQVGKKHHFTLMCKDFSQLGKMVVLPNTVFRAINQATPGPYTFILPATKEVPRRMLNPTKHTIGVRIPDHKITQALLAELGEPILTSTLLLPGEDEPPTFGWDVMERLGHQLDFVIDGSEVGSVPTTVIDFTSGSAEIVREGAGDVERFV